MIVLELLIEGLKFLIGELELLDNIVDLIYCIA
jgi:hypothetical protein